MKSIDGLIQLANQLKQGINNRNSTRILALILLKAHTPEEKEKAKRIVLGLNQAEKQAFALLTTLVNLSEDMS